jgi:hypothetical protein
MADYSCQPSSDIVAYTNSLSSAVFDPNIRELPSVREPTPIYAEGDKYDKV